MNCKNFVILLTLKIFVSVMIGVKVRIYLYFSNIIKMLKHNGNVKVIVEISFSFQARFS